jgi:hypothetical protein
MPGRCPEVYIRPHSVTLDTDGHLKFLSSTLQGVILGMQRIREDLALGGANDSESVTDV